MDPNWDALYDSRGRNLKEQRSRQNKVPWVKVKYTRGKIIIPYEIKSLVNFNHNIISYK
jgi:uncharacterized protein with HEPN domain